MSSSKPDDNAKQNSHETVSKYGRKKPAGPWWLAVFAAPVALTVAATSMTSDPIEKDLVERTKLALNNAGHSYQDVSFDGRDAKITADPASKDQVVDVVNAVDGVRLTSFFAAKATSPTEGDAEGSTGEASASASGEASPSASASESADGAEATATASATEESESAEGTETTTTAASVTGFKIARSGEEVQATIPVPSEEEGGKLAVALESAVKHAGGLDLSLEVTEGAAAMKAPALAKLIDAVAPHEGVTVTEVDGVLQIAGEVASAKTQQDIVAAGKALNENVKLTDSLKVNDPAQSCSSTIEELAASASELQIQFKTGSARVISQDLAGLRTFGKTLAGCSHDQELQVIVVVEGYADSVGPDSLNKALSMRRAVTVKGELVRLGVKKDVINTAAYGSSMPVGDNETAAGRAKNRRVEIIVK